MNGNQTTIERLLAEADIVINGHNPFDLQVNDDRFYKRVMREGSLGLGEAFMDGWWDCQRLDEFFYRVLAAGVDKKIRLNLLIALPYVWNVFSNQGRRSKAFDVGQCHYDIGNDLYRAMLDQRLTYTCGYWKDAADLDQAQEAKLDLVCRKIGLKPGQKILDIGSGWGCFLRYAAEKYGAETEGITVSREQQTLADELCRDLPARTRLMDYRDLSGQYDNVVSLGMIEHVGYKNYRPFFKTVHRVLKDDGFFLLQTIGGLRSGTGCEPWINKYIFPNSMLPSTAQLMKASEGLFVLEDVHSFGADYDRTLMAWHRNFTDNWDKLKSIYDEKFFRMWSYYLLSCAGSFRARKNQLWQFVFSKKGVAGGYRAIR